MQTTSTTARSRSCELTHLIHLEIDRVCTIRLNILVLERDSTNDGERGGVIQANVARTTSYDLQHKYTCVDVDDVANAAAAAVVVVAVAARRRRRRRRRYKLVSRVLGGACLYMQACVCVVCFFGLLRNEGITVGFGPARMGRGWEIRGVRVAAPRRVSKRVFRNGHNPLLWRHVCVRHVARGPFASAWRWW